jgi:hypothetical protein
MLDEGQRRATLLSRDLRSASCGEHDDPGPDDVWAGSDQGDRGVPVGDEGGAAQDECPHHDLGHVGLRGQHPPELAAGTPGDPTVGPHPAAHQGTSGSCRP